MLSCGGDVLNRSLDASIGRQQRRNASPAVSRENARADGVVSLLLPPKKAGEMGGRCQTHLHRLKHKCPCYIS